jgi:hypothetical protein
LIALIAALALSTLPARDTASVRPKGSWSTGIFNPTRYALSDSVELEANPLLFLVAPNAAARLALDRTGSFDVTAEVGLLVPTFGMRLMQGYFFPVWATSDSQIGWMAIPRVGLISSTRVRGEDVWTLRGDFWARIPFGRNHATPIESMVAPLDLLLAPALTGFLERVGTAYDLALGERVRVRAEANLYLTGGTPAGYAPLSPVYVTGHLGVDFGLGPHTRVTAGVLYANYDQGATEVVPASDGFSTRRRVRSANLLPTLDFIWSY